MKPSKPLRGNKERIMRKRKPFDWWTKAHDLESCTQGWALFDADGEVSIQKLDNVAETQEDKGLKEKPPELPSDSVALSLVVKQALQGSKACILALYLEGRPSDVPVDVPQELRRGG
jgi:hypothetical protein